MTFTISGKISGGKNHLLIDPRSGRHYPSPEWARWRDQAVRQLLSQRKGLAILFSEPVWLTAQYIPPDRRRRDATALLDALFHVLEHANIVSDDSLVKRIDWTEMSPHKEQAQLIFMIGRIE